MAVNHRDQEADKIVYYHSQRSHLHQDCMSYEAFFLVDLAEICGDVQFRSPTGDEETSSTLFQTVRLILSTRFPADALILKKKATLSCLLSSLVSILQVVFLCGSIANLLFMIMSRWAQRGRANSNVADECSLLFRKFEACTKGNPLWPSISQNPLGPSFFSKRME